MRLIAVGLLVGSSSAGAFAPPIFTSSRTVASALNIAAGDAIPAVSLHEDFPPAFVNLGTYAKGKKLVIVGLPGAFTPT